MNTDESARHSLINLEESIVWRKSLWLIPCQFVIADPNRFRGKRILDLGSRDGSMAKYFESLGAEVEACDIKEQAVSDLERAGIAAFAVDPYWNDLESDRHDFIFTVLSRNL